MLLFSLSADENYATQRAMSRRLIDEHEKDPFHTSRS
jgi:hypothetical protein